MKRKSKGTSMALFLTTMLLVSQSAMPIFAEDAEAGRQTLKEEITLPVNTDGDEGYGRSRRTNYCI